MADEVKLEANEHVLIGIDPGEKVNGVAVLLVTEGPSSTAKLVMGFRPDTDMLAGLLEKWSVVKPHICMEEFLLFPDDMKRANSTQQLNKTKAQRWNRMKTSQSIGIITHYVRKCQLPLHQCRSVDHKSAVTHTFLQKAGLWGEYNYKDGGHIRDATSVAVYFWRIKGIFNNGQRVITDTDLAFLT